MTAVLVDRVFLHLQRTLVMSVEKREIKKGRKGDRVE